MPNIVKNASAMPADATLNRRSRNSRRSSIGTEAVRSRATNAPSNATAVAERGDGVCRGPPVVRRLDDRVDERPDADDRQPARRARRGDAHPGPSTVARGVARRPARAAPAARSPGTPSPTRSARGGTRTSAGRARPRRRRSRPTARSPGRARALGTRWSGSTASTASRTQPPAPSRHGRRSPAPPSRPASPATAATRNSSRPPCSAPLRPNRSPSVPAVNSMPAKTSA